jgi:hypothetical protein
VSPAQLLRKTLHYIACGVVPLNYTAPTEKSYHNYMEEVFEHIPNTLFLDHDLQSPESSRGKELRARRMP